MISDKVKLKRGDNERKLIRKLNPFSLKQKEKKKNKNKRVTQSNIQVAKISDFLLPARF